MYGFPIPYIFANFRKKIRTSVHPYIRTYCEPCIRNFRPLDSSVSEQQGSQYVRMYGSFFGNSQKCTELGIRTSVHDDFNPCTDKCKSVHGNPYILRGLLYKNGLFSSFFSYFFCFLPIFSKFSRFAQIYNIYSMISNEFLIIQVCLERRRGNY